MMARGWFVALANMALRGLGLVGRFVLMIYLARYLGVDAVGQFGLVYGVVAILPAVAGFGLNFRLNREVIGVPLVQAGAMIRDRLLVTLCVFATLAAAALVARSFGWFGATIPWLPLLCVIAVGEGLAFDIHMSLISVKRPLLANVLLFVRTSSWIYPFIGLGLLVPALRSFEALLWFWSGALGLTFVVLMVGLRDWPWRGIAERAIDVPRLRRTVARSWLIYLSDLGIVGSAFLDRFIINHDLGLEQTGIFTFYWSLANAVQLLVGAAIVQVAMPRLVEASRLGSANLWSGLRNEGAKVLMAGVAVSILLYLVIDRAMPYLERPSLLGQMPMFALMLAAAVTRLLSDVANYGLYASGQDTAWSLTNLCGVVLSALTTLVGLHVGGIFGVACAMMVTAAVLLAARLCALARFRMAPGPRVAPMGGAS